MPSFVAWMITCWMSYDVITVPDRVNPRWGVSTGSSAIRSPSNSTPVSRTLLHCPNNLKPLCQARLFPTEHTLGLQGQSLHHRRRAGWTAEAQAGVVQVLSVTHHPPVHISQDFVPGLSLSKGKSLNVVDRFSKTAHFMPLSILSTAKEALQLVFHQGFS